MTADATALIAAAAEIATAMRRSLTVIHPPRSTQIILLRCVGQYAAASLRRLKVVLIEVEGPPALIQPESTRTRFAGVPLSTLQVQWSYRPGRLPCGGCLNSAIPAMTCVQSSRSPADYDLLSEQRGRAKRLCALTPVWQSSARPRGRTLEASPASLGSTARGRRRGELWRRGDPA